MKEIKGMKNQWRVIAGFILVFIIVLFAVFNNTPVPIKFGVTIFEAPLILVIIGSALIGAIIVILVSTSTIWQQKKEISNLEKKVAEFQTNFDEKLLTEKESLERELKNQFAEETTHYQQELAEKEEQIAQLIKRLNQ